MKLRGTLAVGVASMFAAANIASAFAPGIATSGNTPNSVTYPLRGACGSVDITQNTDPNTVNFGASVACFDGTNVCTVENFYARGFNLGAGPTAGASHFVRCVEYGIDEALGSNAVEIRLYQDTNGNPPNNANLVLLASLSDLIPDGTAAGLRTVDFSSLNVLVPANATLVVEVYSPDLCTTVGPFNYYFNGSNGNGQSAPSYIKSPGAAGCGIDEYTPLSAIGFPNQHMVLTVELEGAGACCVSDPAYDCLTTDAAGCAAAGGTFTPGGACGPDTDGDGVEDFCDNCPAIPNNFDPGGLKSQVDNPEPNPALPDAPSGVCGAPGPAMTRVITVTESGIINDLNVSIEITHSWYGDVDLVLSKSGGPSIQLLANATPDDSSNLGGVYVLDDEAAGTLDAAAVAAAASATLITPGTYRPDSLLSAFDGIDKAGDWTLTFTDWCNLDSGTFGSWTLTFDNAGSGSGTDHQSDVDGDGVGDKCDNCPMVANSGQEDANGNGIGNACDCGDGLVVAGEECDGGLCCSSTCTFVAAGTECRASAGNCDVAESCSGSSSACPSDGFQVGTVCRPSAGVCDVAESCSGTGPICPPDGFAPSSQVCNASAGPCDVAENCTGSGAACPPDGFASAATVCRPSAGVCDVAENCSGSGAACPGDGFVAGGTECRPAAGPCDVSEACDGSSAGCPTDGFSSGNVCRAAAGVCDVAESCDGTGAGCPADGFLGGVECRAGTGECDPAESCDGGSANCPPDATITECGPADGCCPSDTCFSDIDGDADCPTSAIPTVSEWGLVIMTLLLLAAWKVYFGRRPVQA